MSILMNEINLTDLRLAFFLSLNELKTARLLFREDKDFQGIPWDDSPPLSLVIPSRAVALLKKKGLFFQVKEPSTQDSLTPQQHKALDENKAILCKCLFGATFFLERISPTFEKGTFYVKN